MTGELAGGAQERGETMGEVGDIIPGGVLYQTVTAPDGSVRYTYISAGVERLFGLTAASVMADADAFRQLIVDDDRPKVAAAEQEGLRDATPFECEFRWRAVTGEIRWVHGRATGHRREDGAIVWNGVLLDITDRKRLEAEAAARQLRLGMALEAAGMVTWEWDIPTRSVQYSPEIRDIVRGTAVERYSPWRRCSPKSTPTTGRDSRRRWIKPWPRNSPSRASTAPACWTGPIPGYWARARR